MGKHEATHVSALFIQEMMLNNTMAKKGVGKLGTHVFSQTTRSASQKTRL